MAYIRECPSPRKRRNSRYSHYFGLLGVQTKFIQQIKSTMQVIPFRQTHTKLYTLFRTERSKTIPDQRHIPVQAIKRSTPWLSFMSWVIFDPSHYYLCDAETTLIGPAIYCSYEHLSSRVLLTLELFQEQRCLSMPVLFQYQRIFIAIRSRYCQTILGIGI